MRWICLMYHDVVAAPSNRAAGGGPERFTVTRDSFERMLDAIRAADAEGCSLEDALRSPGRARVAITFDDGTSGQFEHAAPALRERGMTATFFVTTSWVGTPGFMGWDELRRLREWGMSVQSHTVSHPYLSELPADRLRHELEGSKATLDRELGQTTTQLALPAGNAPRRGLRHLLREVGYEVVATSRWGRNQNGASGAWIRRCTAPRELTDELARRIVSGDARLAASRVPREMALNGMRAVLGASRYSRWRRRVLDALAPRTTPGRGVRA